MRTRKKGSHVRTMGRAIRAGNRQAPNSLRMAEAVAMLADLSGKRKRINAYSAAFNANGARYKAVVRRLQS